MRRLNMMNIMQLNNEKDFVKNLSNSGKDNLPSKTEETKKKKKNEKGRGYFLNNTVITVIILMSIAISSLFGAVFGCMSGGMASAFSAKFGAKLSKYIPIMESENVDKKINKQQIIIEDSEIIEVVEKSSPAVVSINISKNIPSYRNYFNNPEDLFYQFFGYDVQTPGDGDEEQKVGGGSGFFISSDGMILTNRHVVEDQNANYTVVTNDGKQYKATVLARDPVRDAAVIKIEGTGFPTLPLGDSDSLKIGQTTIAIGNSLGEFANSVSRGIVSGLKRNLSAGSGFGTSERLTDIIQTDAAINPGNSGGPLLDIEGKVIGVNVAIAQGAQNVGFALPINQAKRVIEQAKSGKKIAIPFLGVRYVIVNSSVQKEAQLPFDYGALVLRGNKLTELAVVPGSPADKAGIVENDIILEVEGEKLDQDNQLGDIISRYNVGDEITLKVWHKGEIKTVKVTLQELKN